MNSIIAETAIIHPSVKLGDGVIIEDFCVIGEGTTIGDGSIIRSHTVIYPKNTIGKCFHTGNKANIRENNTIGDNVSIGTLSIIEHHVKIGNGVRIHTSVFVPEYSVLEDECWLGPCVVLTNAKYPQSPGVKESLEGPIVQSRAKIGANVTILPGVIIGENSLVGAGSVVTQDVENGTIVVGNPARFLRNIHY